MQVSVGSPDDEKSKSSSLNTLSGEQGKGERERLVSGFQAAAAPTAVKPCIRKTGYVIREQLYS